MVGLVVLLAVMFGGAAVWAAVANKRTSARREALQQARTKLVAISSLSREALDEIVSTALQLHGFKLLGSFDRRAMFESRSGIVVESHVVDGGTSPGGVRCQLVVNTTSVPELSGRAVRILPLDRALADMESRLLKEDPAIEIT